MRLPSVAGNPAETGGLPRGDQGFPEGNSGGSSSSEPVVRTARTPASSRGRLLSIRTWEAAIHAQCRTVALWAGVGIQTA